MAAGNAKVPKCVKLEQNGTCSLKMLGATVSDDAKAIRIDLYDIRGQVFPIAMTGQDLCDLLQVVGYMSAEMANKQEAAGGTARVHILRQRAGQDLPPLRVRFVWSADSQKATVVIGNAGLQFPMDADTAKSIGQSLVEKAAPHATGQAGTKH